MGIGRAVAQRHSGAIDAGGEQSCDRGSICRQGGRQKQRHCGGGNYAELSDRIFLLHDLIFLKTDCDNLDNKHARIRFSVISMTYGNFDSAAPSTP